MAKYFWTSSPNPFEAMSIQWLLRRRLLLIVFIILQYAMVRFLIPP